MPPTIPGASRATVESARRGNVPQAPGALPSGADTQRSWNRAVQSGMVKSADVPQSYRKGTTGR